MQPDRIGVGALLQRATEAVQCEAVGRLTDDDENLAIRSETKIWALGAQLMEPSGDLPYQPLLGGQVLGLGPVHGVPDTNSLVIGQRAALRFAILQGTQAKVHLDAQCFRTWVPAIAVAGGMVDAAHDGGHVDGLRVLTADASGDEHAVAVHGHFHTGERKRIADNRCRNQCVGNGVAEFVGVAREHKFRGI
jgi:hypothetical protein